MGESRTLIGILAAILAVGSLGLFAYIFLGSRRQDVIRNLMGGSQGMTPEEIKLRREQIQNDPTGQELERLKKERRGLRSKKQKLTLDQKFFQAGIYSDQDKREFLRLRIICPLVMLPAFAFISWGWGFEMQLAVIALGVALGFQLPFSMLDRRIKKRADDIMYYLPLVIEQVAIGVSSSLDIGPCLQRIVTMADERDSHNVVTELIRHAQYYVKSGVSLEDALNEIGKLSGHTELKHAFMSLAQVLRHGGEVTRQLQELADSVAGQRETSIEAKIKKLELQATGPVALVFAGFLVIILVGFGLQLKGAF